MKQAMGIQHFLLLLIYLDPLNVFCAVPKRTKAVPKKKPKEVNSTVAPTASTQRITQVHLPPAVNYDTCRGYYDVSGAYDKEFACNHTDHHYCCGTCYLRFCCQFKNKRLDQKACKNYQKPTWDQTSPPAPAPTEDTYDPSMDQTNTAVYITCGVIAFIIVLGVSVKVAYDKANQPPQEMNIHRALADILRQQGPIPISQYDCENFAAMNSSPKDNTPARTGSKNHYTPVHTSKSNHSGHYGKESSRSGGHDLHNFISSGFVTLGRGHVKGEKHWPVRSQSHHGAHQHNYNHVGLSSPTRTPKNAHRSLRHESSRMNNILTSQTEPYDLSFSRSFQSLSHLPPSYESAMKADLNRFSSLKKLSDKDVDDHYSRKRHLPDLAIRGTLPLHVIRNQESQGSQPTLSQQQQQHQQAAAQQQQQQQGAPSQRQRPRRVQRAMSQDRVLSPERGRTGHEYAAAIAATASSSSRGMSSAYGGMSPYGGRILSDEQLLSAERLRSHERLLSQERLYSHERHYSHERLHSSDRLYSHDRLYSQDRLHSQDPLLSPDKMMSIKRSAAAAAMSGFRSDKSMSRAISHTDVHMPTTPLMDRYKMTKMHSHPSASNNVSQQPPQQQQQPPQQHNTLNRNQTASKRQAFASRRTQTVEQFQYIPSQQQQQQHHHQHYRTGSKTEVTV